MRLILIRHGESVGNLENRLQGQEEYDLTELGKQQSLVTGERLLVEGVTALYTSPLSRTVDTAGAIAAATGLTPVNDPDLAEYSFGALSGMTYREVREHFQATPATASLPPAEREYPGEEGRSHFFDRVTAALWGIAARHNGETVAVVSHGGPIALFCQTVLGLPYKRPMPFAIDNCSLAFIDIADGSAPPDAVLVSLNDTSHLDTLRE